MPRVQITQRRALVDIGALDSRLFSRVARSDLSGLERALPALSLAANNALLWHATAAVLARFGGRMGKRAAIRGSGSIAVTSAIVNLAVKPLVRRPRPSLRNVPAARRLAAQPLTTSFPSGHAASAFAFTAGVGTELPALALPVGLTAGAVAYSRVYTGVHYPSDVTAGAMLGLAVGLGSRLVWPPAPRAARAEPPSRHRLTAPRSPDGTGVAVVVSAAAGPGDGAPDDDLRERLPEAEIVVLDAEDCGPAPLRSALESAAERCEVLGICGGDGSANVAAQVALERDMPLLVVPGGTLNHLSHDLAIESPADALEALARGDAVAIDLGMIDGRPFLNTASFGAYTDMVDRRNELEARVGRWPAQLAALVAALLRGRPLKVRIDGEERTVWMAFVGNCEHEPPGVAPSGRARIDDGLLDVRLIDASRPASRLRAVAAMATGRLATSRGYRRWTTDRVEVSSDLPSLRLSADGDPFEGSPSFTVDKRPSALVVYARGE